MYVCVWGGGRGGATRGAEQKRVPGVDAQAGHSNEGNGAACFDPGCRGAPLHTMAPMSHQSCLALQWAAGGLAALVQKEVQRQAAAAVEAVLQRELQAVHSAVDAAQQGASACA